MVATWPPFKALEPGSIPYPTLSSRTGRVYRCATEMVNASFSLTDRGGRRLFIRLLERWLLAMDSHLQKAGRVGLQHLEMHPSGLVGVARLGHPPGGFHEETGDGLVVLVLVVEGDPELVGEVVRCEEMKRLRGQIAEPPGWVSLEDLEDGSRWFEGPVPMDEEGEEGGMGGAVRVAVLMPHNFSNPWGIRR